MFKVARNFSINFCLGQYEKLVWFVIGNKSKDVEQSLMLFFWFNNPEILLVESFNVNLKRNTFRAPHHEIDLRMVTHSKCYLIVPLA